MQGIKAPDPVLEQTFTEVWEEYIFKVDSELTEKQILEAEIAHPEPPIMGMWSVVIPVRLIQKK